MKYTLDNIGKGLNLDLLPSELPPGTCSNGINVRFRNGFAERVNGIANVDASFLTPYQWLSLYPSSLPTYKVFLVYATNNVVYAYNLDATHSEITRYQEGVVINSITAVGTTATVTTATNHGLSTGNTVSHWGAVPTAYNVTSTITVTGATTYTYTTASAPGGPATTVGLYSYNGATVSFTSSTTTPKPQQFSGGAYNGLFIFNSPADGLYYWNGDITTRLRKIPLSYKAKVSRPFGDFIVQLSPTVDGTEYPYRIVWSDAAEPGAIPTSFSSTSTNKAGFKELVEIGPLVDCLEMGDTLIIYGTTGRVAMRFIDGEPVMGFTRLPGEEGLLYRGCVTDTPVGHVFLSNSLDVLLHTGGVCKNLSAGRVNKPLKEAYSANIERSFVFKNPQRNEVWVCYPTGTVSGNFCDTALLWNWVDNTWGNKTLSAHGLSCGVSGVPGTLLLSETAYVTANDSGASRGRIGRLEADYLDFVNTAFNSIVEFKGLDLGDRDIVKNLSGSRLNFDYRPAASYTVTVEHGASMSADVAPTYATGVTYTLGTTDYARARATGGRFVAIRVTWSSSVSIPEDSGKLRSIDLDASAGGKR